MRIAKRLEKAQAAAAGDAGENGSDKPAIPEPQERHGQLPPLRRRRGSDSQLPREKDSLLSPAVPTPPKGPKSTKRSPKAGAAGGAGDAAPDTAARSEKKVHGKRDPLEGRKLNLMSYVVFLGVFVAASSNGRTPDMYYQNSVVETYMSLGQVSASVPRSVFSCARYLKRALLLQASFTGYDVRPSFSELVKWSDFWTWMIRGFAPGIFDDELLVTKSSATNASSTSRRHKSQSLYLISGFRLHQVRVRSVDCRGAFSTWLCVQGCPCLPRWSCSRMFRHVCVV
jgi:hypothetical protein